MNHVQNDSLKVYGNPDHDGDGMPNPQWIADNIRHVLVPWHMVAEWDNKATIRSIPIHRICAPSLEQILGVLWADTFGTLQKVVDVAGLDQFAGSFAYRMSRHGHRLSEHAFAGAIDWDSKRNAMGKHWRPMSMMPKSVVDVFERFGWTWGGLWSTPDAMHFQYARVS